MAKEQKPGGVEGAILDAIESGAFDNLSTSGQPLNLRVNAFEPPEMRLANQIMKDHDVVPPWLGERQTLEKDIQKLRDKLARTWKTHQEEQCKPILQRATTHWHNIADRYRTRIAELNKRIRDYNLKAPTIQVHLMPLNADAEFRRAGITSR